MAGQEGSPPKKDDGAGGSSKPAPDGDGSSCGSTDGVENLGLENPHDVPGDATVAEQGKCSAPSTGSAAAAADQGKEAVASSNSCTADMGKEAGGSHGTALDKGKGVASAVAGDVSAHADAGTGEDESKIEQMTALVAQLPPVPPAPQAPLAHHKGKKKGNSAGQGGSTSTRSKTRNKGTNSSAKNQGPFFIPPPAVPEIAPAVLFGAAFSGIQQGLHLRPPQVPIPPLPHLRPPQVPIPPQLPGAELCVLCQRALAETSLFVTHVCLCSDCHRIIIADPYSTPCLLCQARLANPPP